MTWADWLESDYNTLELTANADDEICFNIGILTRNGNSVLINYYVIENAEYELVSIRVETLLGTTWVFDDGTNIEASAGFGDFAINFEDDGTQYDSLWIGYFWVRQLGETVERQDCIVFASEENIGLNLNSEDFPVEESVSITFTGGTDVADSDLIDWFYNNATLISID